MSQHFMSYYLFSFELKGHRQGLIVEGKGIYVRLLGTN
jgi:hypothetical protein